MRKQITLTIDADVYNGLQDLPRKVSVSEVASWMLKIFTEQYKMGRELTQEEFEEIIKRTPGGADFRERFREDPTVKKIAAIDDKVTEVVEHVKRKVGRPPKNKV